MDEETAKTKWCPFVRHSTQNQTHGGADPGINRYGAGIDFNKDSGVGAGDIAWNKCIGSECMAWRRNTRGAVKSRKDASIRLLNPGDTYDPGAEIHFEAYDETSGHCGLAGKP